MSFFTPNNEETAREIISRYPRERSALIPLLHLAQEQEGWITKPAMEQIAELTRTTPVEVLGTGTFYEMFKFHPVGRYLVNICTNISCQLLGADELLEHAQETLGVKHGDTTTDQLFTVEEVECVAACTEAPCFTVNYRYFHRATKELFDEVVTDLRAGESPLAKGKSADQGPMPEHGTLSRVRQQIPETRIAGIVPPEKADKPPLWIEEATLDA